MNNTIIFCMITAFVLVVAKLLCENIDDKNNTKTSSIQTLEKIKEKDLNSK